MHTGAIGTGRMHMQYVSCWTRMARSLAIASSRQWTAAAQTSASGSCRRGMSPLAPLQRSAEDLEACVLDSSQGSWANRAVAVLQNMQYIRLT